jgi:hypothetical protein
MTNRFTFPISAAGPYARLVVDTWSGQQVAGTVTRDIGGAFTYQRAVWDGTRQVYDTFSADTLDELSRAIDAYLEPTGV